MNKAPNTRQRLVEAAKVSVLEKGFGATSIDELIAEVNITKSGFFYHFKDKGELARALLEDYIEQEEKLLDDIFDRGRDLADDPLQAFLISLKLLARTVEDLPEGHPGCLIATYCYQERLFDHTVRELNRNAVLGWRARFRAIFEDISARYPPREEIDLDVLADMVSTILEGGIVMSKALGTPRILPQQVLLFRNMMRAMFLPDAQLSRAPAAG